MRSAALVCPYCRSHLLSGLQTRQCRDCYALYHAECWNEYGRCSVFGCQGSAGGRQRHELLFVPAILWTVCLLHQAVAVMFSFLLAPAITYCVLATLYYLWDLFYRFHIARTVVRERFRHDLLFVVVNVFPIALTILLRTA